MAHEKYFLAPALRGVESLYCAGMRIQAAISLKNAGGPLALLF
jgi:hypothetical protein